MAAGRKTSRFIIAGLLGLTGTVLVATAWRTGLLDRVEWTASDVRSRTAAFAEPTGAVVVVAIDDTSIKHYGRWPWPREKIAGLIDVLTECRARTIALDIIFPTPQKVRLVSAAAEAATDNQAVGGLRAEAINDDLILAAAIARSGRVLVPMHLEPGLETPTTSPADASDPSRRSLLLRARSIASIRRFAMDGPAAANVRREHLLRGRITPPLVIFADGAVGTGFVNTEPDPDGVVRRIAMLAQSEAGVHQQLAVTAAALMLGGKTTLLDDEEAMHLGTPGQAGGRTIGVDSAGRMTITWIPAKAPRARISAAKVLKAWEMGRDLADLSGRRRKLGVQLLRLVRFEDADTEDKRWDVTDGLEGKLIDLAEMRFAAEYQWHLSQLYGPADPQRAVKAAALRDKEKQLRQQQLEAANPIVAMLRDPEAMDKALATAAANPAAVNQMPVAMSEVPALAGRLLEQLSDHGALRARLEQKRAAAIESLKNDAGERVCLVGSTSTGAPDFVATPMGPKTPGVMVHADIIETVLAGKFVTTAPTWLNLLAIVAAGAAVTLLAAYRPVTSAGPITVLLAAGYVVLNVWVIFARGQTELTLAAPVLAMAAAFMFVTAWRQLTEEREKRWVRGLLVNTMSNVLVEQVEQNPDLLQLGGESRELTCMFSDLAGFTPLAERLGPQRTVKLLNHYFDHVTEVVQEQCGGYLSKFLGDGIFVFFGAPIFQEDHARRAMLAAVAYIDEVKVFNTELAQEDPEPVELSVRIGLATGESVVGNCGSTAKIDYTAIGDFVNLSSRLEAANKFLGTSILVAESTWQAGGSDQLVQRPLGQISVQGVAEAVRVRHIVGHADAVDAALATAVADFTAAMELFEARKFAEARELFLKVPAHLPDDKATDLYLARCETYAATPPPDDWPGHVIDIAK